MWKSIKAISTLRPEHLGTCRAEKEGGIVYHRRDDSERSGAGSSLSMKQLLEFLPLVLFFTAYQMDGEVLTVGDWSHTPLTVFSVLRPY